MDRDWHVGSPTRAILALLAALLVSVPIDTVVASEGGGGATASDNATPRDGELPQDLNGVLTLYRNGASGLGIPTTFLMGGSPERAVAVGDLNGDGNTDLAVSEAGSDKAWILLGAGAG